MSSDPKLTNGEGTAQADSASLQEALAILLCRWGGRAEPHVLDEARIMAGQFLREYPMILALKPLDAEKLLTEFEEASAEEASCPPTSYHQAMRRLRVAREAVRVRMVYGGAK